MFGGFPTLNAVISPTEPMIDPFLHLLINALLKTKRASDYYSGFSSFFFQETKFSNPHEPTKKVLQTL